MSNQPTFADLFCGCGGTTAGFKAAGFRALFAIDIDPVAAQTYRQNHPEVLVCVEDIRCISPRDVQRQCQINKGDLVVLSASSPCQPFSRLTRGKEEDPRAPLVLEIARFAETLFPVFLFIENVPGLLKSPLMDRLLEEIGKIGYHNVVYSVVNAADYGVPQVRRRLILLASRLNTRLEMPEPTHARPKDAHRLGRAAWVTVQEAFVGLERLEPGEGSATDPLHRASHHSAESIERLKHIPPNGGSRNSLPTDLQFHRFNRGQVGYSDVYGRLDFRKPSVTLTTGCTDFTKGRFAHPTENRAITLREAARLQTFPDSYQFCGSSKRQIAAQIGNAVPPKLAYVFACHLLEVYQQSNSNAFA